MMLPDTGTYQEKATQTCLFAIFISLFHDRLFMGHFSKIKSSLTTGFFKGLSFLHFLKHIILSTKHSLLAPSHNYKGSLQLLSCWAAEITAPAQCSHKFLLSRKAAMQSWAI